MSITKTMAGMSPEERSEYMRDIRSKVKKPGFASMGEEQRKAIAHKGGQATKIRWQNEKKQNPDSQT